MRVGQESLTADDLDFEGASAEHKTGYLKLSSGTAAASKLSRAQASATDNGGGIVKMRYASPTVYIYDKTSKSKAPGSSAQLWNVKAAAASWSAQSKLNLIYRTKPCPKAQEQCITVKEGKLKSPTVGLTRWFYYDKTIYYAEMTLDPSWGKRASTSLRKSDVTHELGHAIGFAHAKSAASVMYPYVGRSKPMTRELNELKALYGN